MFFNVSLFYSVLAFSRNENTGNTNKKYKNAANTTIKSKTIYIKCTEAAMLLGIFPCLVSISFLYKF